MFADVLERARGQWQSILPQMGVPSSLLDGRHHPCPKCGGKNRFRFTDHNKDGFYFCNGCGTGDGFKLLELTTGRSNKEALKEVAALLGVSSKVWSQKADESILSRREMKQRWEGATAPTIDSPVGLYLASRLGRYWKSKAIRESGTTMVSRITDTNGHGVNLHLTFLTKDGKKASVTPQRKVMRGTLPAGCSIALWEPAETMGIAEGIETAMSAAILFKMPVWAAISATMLTKWEPPAIARNIVIFADNDATYAGQAAAYALAHRLVVLHGRNVDIRLPDKPGEDWNDILRQGRA